MSFEEWFENIYRMAAGWLGWSDHEAMTTPVPRIMAAVEGRLDWEAMRTGHRRGGGSVQEVLAELGAIKG